MSQSNPYSLGRVTSELSTLPKVIVLLHGATPAPSDKAFPLVVQPNSGTLDFTRFYFSESFARALLGSPSTIKTLNGINVTGTLWDAHSAADSNSKVTYNNGCNEGTLGHHLIVPGDFTGTGTPSRSLFIAYRDASQGLMPQTKAAITQIYDKYAALFGTAGNPISGKQRPNIIFVTHSMGALVARSIISAPTDPIQGSSLTVAERQKAEALRDRTIAVVSLAGPHEGSPLASRATDIASWLNADGKGLLDTFSIVLPNSWRAAVDQARQEKVQQLGKPANQDLRVDFWSQMNDGALHPSRGKRSDNTLIPIYTLIGHTPAGRFFINPDTQWPTGGILDSLTSNEANRRDVLRSMGLMFIDYALHNVPTSTTHRHWGANPRDEFDIIARYHRKDLGLTLSAPGEDEGVPWGIPKFYNRDHVTEPIRDLFGNITGTRVKRTNSDDRVDSDGLVSVASGHGYRLSTSTNFYFDHTNNYTLSDGTSVRGSWYRIMPLNAWKYSNHETIHRLRDVGDYIHDNIIATAGPLPGEGATSVWPALRLPTITDPIRRLTGGDGGN